jgi:hypothetical protein
MDAKFENWESGIPPEFRPGTTPEQEIIHFVGLSQSEIKTYTRHRYMITTWYRFTRLKLYTLALKRHQPLVSTATRIESPGPIRTFAEKGIRFALELIKDQCDTFSRMRRTKSGEKWLGGNWYFEGCLSLFEAAAALLLVLTRFPTTFLAPPGAKLAEDTKTGLRLEYEEMSRVISRVVDVFSEVVVTENDLASNSGEKEGKRAEIASKALDTLQVLLREHWWKLDPRLDQTASTQAIDNSAEFSTSASSAQSSPRRAGLSPPTGAVGSGPGLPYDASGYGDVEMYHSQQIGNTQAYSGLVTPLTETTPSPLSMQQHNYQVQPSVYGSTGHYPMATGTNFPSYIQPPFRSPPLPTPDTTSYPQYSQGPTPEAMPPMIHPLNPSLSPYDYQPENYSFNTDFSSIAETSVYTTPFPFTPMSDPSQAVGRDQNRSSVYQNQNQSQSQSQPQEYHPQRMPHRHQRSFSTSTQPIPLPPNSAASAYAYDPSSSSSSRPMRSSPGVPPPSQGMKMIHYVAPGLATTTTTTASGMGVIENSTGTFTVSPQEPSRQQQSTIGLSDLMGLKTPTGTPGDQGGDTSCSGYYQ